MVTSGHSMRAVSEGDLARNGCAYTSALLEAGRSAPPDWCAFWFDPPHKVPCTYSSTCEDGGPLPGQHCCSLGACTLISRSYTEALPWPRRCETHRGATQPDKNGRVVITRQQKKDLHGPPSARGAMNRIGKPENSGQKKCGVVQSGMCPDTSPYPKRRAWPCPQAPVNPRID
jgi:hypothetical protein